MDQPTTGGQLEVTLFQPHPNLPDSVNAKIIQSEIEGGVYLRDLAPGCVLYITTKNRVYRMEILGNGAALISGHPEWCPEPAEVHIQGSTWGGTMLKTNFVGRGMHLEFDHPVHRRILTSRILEIRVD